MIDTVRFAAPIDLPSGVREHARSVSSYITSAGHERSWLRLGNLSIKTGEYGLYVEGSIARYLNGENVTTLHRRDVSAAIKKLSRDLLIPECYLRDSKLTRLDYGVNIIVGEHPSAYIRALPDPAVLKRTAYSWESVRYGSRRHQIEIYDKTLQVSRRGRGISKKRLRQEHEDRNMLRVEVRHLERLGEQFDRCVVLGDLDDEIFFGELGARIIRDIERFSGAPPVTTGVSGDVRSLMNEYERAGIEALGGREAALARITEGRRNGRLNRSQSHRMRRYVERAMAQPTSTRERDLVSELVALVSQATDKAAS